MKRGSYDWTWLNVWETFQNSRIPFRINLNNNFTNYQKVGFSISLMWANSRNYYRNNFQTSLFQISKSINSLDKKSKNQPALFEIFRQIRVLKVTKFSYLRAFNFLGNLLTFLSSSEEALPEFKKNPIFLPVTHFEIFEASVLSRFRWGEKVFVNIFDVLQNYEVSICHEISKFSKIPKSSDFWIIVR